MAKYLFVYHGGATPETTEDVAAVMAAWEAWMAGWGDAFLDQGNPIGQSKTVTPDGSVLDGGGTNPASGYSLVSAATIDEAVTIAKGCPIFESGGSIQVAEAVDM